MHGRKESNLQLRVLEARALTDGASAVWNAAFDDERETDLTKAERAGVEPASPRGVHRVADGLAPTSQMTFQKRKAEDSNPTPMRAPTRFERGLAP